AKSEGRGGLATGPGAGSFFATGVGPDTVMHAGIGPAAQAAKSSGRSRRAIRDLVTRSVNCRAIPAPKEQVKRDCNEPEASATDYNSTAGMNSLRYSS